MGVDGSCWNDRGGVDVGVDGSGCKGKIAAGCANDQDQKNVYNKLDLETYNKYGKDGAGCKWEIAADWVQKIRSKSVYNKLDLDAYNKYNIENDAAIEIMGKDNGHHHVNKKC